MAAADAVARLLAAPIAHRGLHGCGRGGPVENSLSAAEAAIAGGYGIECDIRLSRDGEAMVFHDSDLARLTGRAGEVGDHEAAALVDMPLAGGRDCIPTLAAFLAAIGGRTPLVIEIKNDRDGDTRLAARAVELVSRYPGVVALESFDAALLAVCRRAGARCPLGLVGPSSDGEMPARGSLGDVDFLSWSVAHLASIGRPALPMSAWTVRTPDDVWAAARAGAQLVFEGFRPPPPPDPPRRRVNALLASATLR